MCDEIIEVTKNAPKKNIDQNKNIYYHITTGVKNFKKFKYYSFDDIIIIKIPDRNKINVDETKINDRWSSETKIFLIIT